jgi:4-coumarate--CoA ligase
VVLIGGSNGDERPRAYVVKSGDINEDDVVGWVRERAARHKWITGGVQFVTAVPKNPSGKILRKVLREMAAKVAPKL